MTRLLWIVCLLSLWGCQPPKPQSNLSAPKATRSGVLIINDPRDFRGLQWWKKWHDPQLNALVIAALRHNNQLMAAKANILQAKAQLQASRFAWLPTLDGAANGFVGGGWDSQITPQGHLARTGLLSQIDTLRFRGYYTGFVPKYSLNILSNMSQTKLAKASLNMQRAVYQSNRLSVIGQITGSYFMLMGQKEQAQVQAALLNDLQQLKQLERVRYQAGASDATTVTSLDSQVDSTKADIASLENSIAQVENAIQLLLNRNPASLKAHQRITQIPTKGMIPAKIPSAVLHHRPDVMIAQQNLHIAEANLGVAYSNFFPSITLTDPWGVRLWRYRIC